VEDREIVIDWLSSAEAVGRAERISQIYREALGHSQASGEHFAETFRRCMASYPGASCLAAQDRGEVVGFVYGFDFVPGHWWPEQITPEMVAAGHEGWLTDTLEIVEVEVDPAYQGQGIGTAMLHRQLGAMRQRQALLATRPDNPARRLYRRLGFAELLPDFTYPGTEMPAVIMGWRRGPGTGRGGQPPAPVTIDRPGQ
jgi:ribosomal protein S18 acetylase RimI-like enzyme